MENHLMPAMPTPPDGRGNVEGHPFPGMTKREYVAALALQALRIANPSCSSHEIAEQAVRDADALFFELEARS